MHCCFIPPKHESSCFFLLNSWGTCLFDKRLQTIIIFLCVPAAPIKIFSCTVVFLDPVASCGSEDATEEAKAKQLLLLCLGKMTSTTTTIALIDFDRETAILCHFLSNQNPTRWNQCCWLFHLPNMCSLAAALVSSCSKRRRPWWKEGTNGCLKVSVPANGLGTNGMWRRM